MKTTVDEFAFLEAFRAYALFDQFGATALRSLFAYLEDLESDIGEELELDVVALCCDYSVDTVEEIAEAYRIDIAGLDEEEARGAVLDYLNDNTTVVDDDCDSSILYVSAF